MRKKGYKQRMHSRIVRGKNGKRKKVMVNPGNIKSEKVKKKGRYISINSGKSKLKAGKAKPKKLSKAELISNEIKESLGQKDFEKVLINKNEVKTKADNNVHKLIAAKQEKEVNDFLEKYEERKTKQLEMLNGIRMILPKIQEKYEVELESAKEEYEATGYLDSEKLNRIHDTYVPLINKLKDMHSYYNKEVPSKEELIDYIKQAHHFNRVALGEGSHSERKKSAQKDFFDRMQISDPEIRKYYPDIFVMEDEIKEKVKTIKKERDKSKAEGNMKDWEKFARELEKYKRAQSELRNDEILRSFMGERPKYRLDAAAIDTRYVIDKSGAEVIPEKDKLFFEAGKKLLKKGGVTNNSFIKKIEKVKDVEDYKKKLFTKFLVDTSTKSLVKLGLKKQDVENFKKEVGHQAEKGNFDFLKSSYVVKVKDFIYNKIKDDPRYASSSDSSLKELAVTQAEDKLGGAQFEAVKKLVEDSNGVISDVDKFIESPFSYDREYKEVQKKATEVNYTPFSSGGK